MKIKEITPQQDMAQYGFSRKSKYPMLTLRTHGLLDYGAAVLFALSPHIFGFAQINQARVIFYAVAAILFGYSLMTEYFQSFMKIIPFALHRAFDIAAGMFLATAPSSFSYRTELTDMQLVIHWLFGVAWVYVALTTRSMGPSEVVEGLKEERETDQMAA
jgi:hypothetical protein